jgi:hypothetical protein
MAPAGGNRVTFRPFRDFLGWRRFGAGLVKLADPARFPNLSEPRIPIFFD